MLNESTLNDRASPWMTSSWPRLCFLRLQRLRFPGKIWFLFEHFGGSLQELFGFNLFFNFQRLPTVFLIIAHNPPSVPGWIYVLMGTIMAHGNSAVNPILYGFSNEKFRQGYRQVLTCRRHGGQINAAAPTGKRTPIAAALGSGSLAFSDTTGKAPTLTRDTWNDR